MLYTLFLDTCDQINSPHTTNSFPCVKFAHFFSLSVTIIFYLSHILFLFHTLPILSLFCPLSPSLQPHSNQSHPQIFFALGQKLCKRLCFDKRKLGWKMPKGIPLKMTLSLFVQQSMLIFCCCVLCDCVSNTTKFCTLKHFNTVCNMLREPRYFIYCLPPLNIYKMENVILTRKTICAGKIILIFAVSPASLAVWIFGRFGKRVYVLRKEIL